VVFRQHDPFSYDALNRRTSATFGVVPPRTFDNRTDYRHDRGNRLLTVTDFLNGTRVFAYDNLDRLTQEQSPQGTAGAGYDAARPAPTADGARPARRGLRRRRL
jgi:YD repeat-containing protein